MESGSIHVRSPFDMKPLDEVCNCIYNESPAVRCVFRIVTLVWDRNRFDQASAVDAQDFLHIDD
eukprot:2038420-Alexandrium_andersonii.AAC.1